MVQVVEVVEDQLQFLQEQIVDQLQLQVAELTEEEVEQHVNCP
jgi:hypothetical protein